VPFARTVEIPRGSIARCASPVYRCARNGKEEAFAMRAKQVFVVAVTGLLSLVAAGGAEAKGCLKGAAVGAVAGHVAGHHAVVGAAAGCAIGHHMAKKKQQQQLRQQQQPSPARPQLPPGQQSTV
jgi:hypothetical protein